MNDVEVVLVAQGNPAGTMLKKEWIPEMCENMRAWRRPLVLLAELLHRPPVRFRGLVPRWAAVGHERQLEQGEYEGGRDPQAAR